MLRTCLMILGFLVLSTEPVLSQEPAPDSGKSKERALEYSLGCTLGPGVAAVALAGKSDKLGMTSDVAAVTLVSLGLLLGPGAGHLYAGQSKRFMTGVIIRTAAVGVVTLGLANLNIFDEDSGAGVPILAGSFAFLSSVIYDIGTVGRSVDRYNRQHGFSNIMLAPCYFAQDGTAGVALTIAL